MLLPDVVGRALAEQAPGGVTVLGDRRLDGGTGAATSEVVLLDVQVPTVDSRTAWRTRWPRPPDLAIEVTDATSPVWFRSAEETTSVSLVMPNNPDPDTSSV